MPKIDQYTLKYADLCLISIGKKLDFRIGLTENSSIYYGLHLVFRYKE
jgi:hypothetical protein